MGGVVYTLDGRFSFGNILLEQGSPELMEVKMGADGYSDNSDDQQQRDDDDDDSDNVRICPI